MVTSLLAEFPSLGRLQASLLKDFNRINLGPNETLLSIGVLALIKGFTNGASLTIRVGPRQAVDKETVLSTPHFQTCHHKICFVLGLLELCFCNRLESFHESAVVRVSNWLVLVIGELETSAFSVVSLTCKEVELCLKAQDLLVLDVFGLAEALIEYKLVI